LQTPGGRMSLHELWDVELLKEDLKRRYESEDAPAQSDEEIMKSDITPHWRLLARELVGETLDPSNVNAKQPETIPSDLDARTWAQESLRLSQTSLFHVSGEVSGQYIDQAIPVMETRLHVAGLRLAAVLNEVFSDRRLYSKGTP